MPNVMQSLRQEIGRLARKEAKVLNSVLHKSSAQYRRDISVLKREVAQLRKTVKGLERQAPKAVAPVVPVAKADKLRFRADGFKTMRAKLGIAAADLGHLLGVSGLTIYHWESGKSKPRRAHLPKIAALRAMGKRQILALLAKAKGGKTGRKSPDAAA